MSSSRPCPVGPAGRAASAPASRLHTTPSTAARASCSRVDVGADAGERAGGVGPVRRALAVEVRDEHEPARAGRRAERQRVEAGRVDAEQPGDGVGDLGGVERADERQVAAGGVGEPGDGARWGRRSAGR